MSKPRELQEFSLTSAATTDGVILVAAPPATVTQRTVEQHFGITPRLFKQMVREGLLRSTRIGQLLVVAYEEVRRVLTAGAGERAKVQQVSERGQGRLSPAVARADLSAASPPGARRARKTELEMLAGELHSRHGPPFGDGSRNSDHDKQLLDHADGLTLTATGMVRGSSLLPSGVAPAVGHYGKCCWCERPAYATKQTWLGDHWSGGPVCAVHARDRAANERVVQIESRTILLPARDSSVPPTYEMPGRRRKSKE
jgi:hypothetical protein